MDLGPQLDVQVPGTVILEGVLGSRAYGLETPDSDYDIKGIYVAPTIDVVSLKPPKETIDHTAPDYCFHEVRKYIDSALKCNPTNTELLYLPEYRVLTEHGAALVERRWMFLSAPRVLGAYGGYAQDQFKRFQKTGSFSSKTKNRKEKHARHLFRLMDQGIQLLTTGTLRVRLDNPEWYREAAQQSDHEIIKLFEAKDIELLKAAEQSVLPAHPDRDGVNHLLRQIRWDHFR